MGIFDWFRRKEPAEENLTEVAKPETAKNELAERVVGGRIYDQDDYLYRPLNSSAQSGIHNEINIDNARKLGRHFYYNHAVAGGLAEMLVDRIIGAGFEVKAADKRVQKVVDQFVNDPINGFHEFLPKYAVERFGTVGELFLPIYLTPADASVRLSYLHPDQVDNVIFSSVDQKQPIAVIQRACDVGGKKFLWIIPHPDPAFDGKFAPHPALTSDDEPNTVEGLDGLPVVVPEDIRLAEILKSGDIQIAGYMFYHRSNCLVSDRGVPIYERIKGYLKAVDDFLMNTLRAAILQGHMIWHCRLIGADPATVMERQKQLMAPPKSGTIIVTNAMEDWKALSPNISPAAQVRELFLNALKMIGISSSIPSHELGGEGDSNRSTAKEAKSISVARAKRMQKDFAAMVLSWVLYQVDQKIYRGMLPRSANRLVQVILPELDTQDESELSSAVKTAVEAMSAALSSPEPLVLPEDARAFVYRMMGQEVPDKSKFDALKPKADISPPDEENTKDA